MAHASCAAGSAFEQLLASSQGGDCKGCDCDEGGCGAPRPIQHALEAAPTVYTISLAWDTAQAPEAEVAATMLVRAFLCA